MSSSSRLMYSRRLRIVPFRKLSVPNAFRPKYRQMLVSCGRDKLSRVRSSEKSLATFRISSGEGVSPVERTLRKNSLNSSDATIFSSPLSPVSRRVSCRNFAISSRTRKSFRCFSSAANLSSNVEGSILGKSLMATGRSSSMNGTITKTENGMSRNRSVVVLRS